MCTEHVPETLENAGKHMDLIEDIQARYLDILPIVQEERNLEQAFAGIVKACNNKVEIFKRQSENPQLPGYYGFLELVFIIIVQLQGTGSREVIPVSAILEPKEAGSCYVIFECPLLQETVTDQIRVKIACSMLNEIGEAYRLRLLLQTDPKGLASIRTVWHAILVGSGKP